MSNQLWRSKLFEQTIAMTSIALGIAWFLFLAYITIHNSAELAGLLILITAFVALIAYLNERGD